MKRLFSTTAVAVMFGLSVAGANAQTYQAPTEQQGGAGECTPGAPNCPKGKDNGEMKATPKGENSKQGAEPQVEKVQPAQKGAGGNAEGGIQPKTDGTAEGAKEKPADQNAKEQKPAADGTTQGSQQKPAGQNTGEQQKPATEGTTQDSQQKPAGQGAQAPAQKGSGSTATGGDVNITVEQKTEIRQVIKEVRVEPADVDIDISVGVAVPRKVKLHRLPPRIVKLVPAYEGYLFFILADGRIVIVDPDTLKIVVIIA